MNDDTPKPVPPLTAKASDGKLYRRFPDVEAEIREVWCRPASGWSALKEKVKNETLVFLIRKSGLKDDDIRGHLQAELNARTIRISESHVKGFDEVIKEEIGLEVEAKIFNLVWSDVNCAQAEFLEIAFAEKVRDLTRNAIQRYKHSVMGERDQLDVATDKDVGEGAFAVVELRQDVLDLRRDQEEMLILLEDETRRDELYQEIYDAVKDPRHFQALYLFHAEDHSLAEIAAHFDTTIRQIRYWKTTAMHQIHVAFGIETEEKREALRKHWRTRRTNRLTQSSAQPKIAKRKRARSVSAAARNIKRSPQPKVAKRKRDSAQPKLTKRPSSQPPSISF
jgi:predicted DNA-binding protein YlxM (UPF0122 family)